MAQNRVRTLALCMAAVIALSCVYMATLEYLGKEPSAPAILLYNIVFAFLVACAVEVDRRTRAVRMPYEYAAFVFFFWPIAAPVYLFHTRRWRGLVTALGVILLFEVPSLASLLVYCCRAPTGT